MAGKKIGIAVVLVLLVIIGVGVFLVGNINSVVQGGIEVAGTEVLKAPVEVQSVDISFFSGTGEITGLKVGNPEGYEGDYAFFVEKMKVALDVSSVASDKIHVREITIENPSIIFEGNFQSNNLQQLQANAESYTASALGEDVGTVSDGGEAGPSVQIDRLAITDASIQVLMSFLGDTPISATLPSLEMEDIGKDEDLSASDVMQEVMGALNDSIVPLIRDNVGNIESQLKEKGDVLKEKVKDGVDKLKSLFNRG